MGKAHVFADDIDTDQIAPGRWLKFDEQTLASHCLEAIDPEFAKNVRNGDVLVSGHNFGMGSSREQAAVSLKTLGISAILAKSAARIFYRNAINLGLPVIIWDHQDAIRPGDDIEIDLRQGFVWNHSRSQRYAVGSLPPSLLQVIEDGGLIRHLMRALQPADDRAEGQL